jgi:hypothetical protein
MNTALASTPDAIGLISWNEFSENTHVEPSEKYGTRYLEAISAFTEVNSPAFVIFDSDSPDAGQAEGAEEGSSRGQITAVSIVMAVALLGLTVIAARARKGTGGAL